MTKFTHLLTDFIMDDRTSFGKISDRLTENLGASRAIAFANRTYAKLNVVEAIHVDAKRLPQGIVPT